MIALVLLFRARPGMPKEEFLRYWHEEHVPLVMRVPGIRHYEIYESEWSPDGQPEYDGMAQLWFDNEAALESALVSDETHATAVDARNFLERGSIARLVMRSRTILEGPVT